MKTPPQAYFTVTDYVSIEDGDISLCDFEEQLAEAKTQFIGKIAEVCLANNIPLVSISDEEIELRGLFSINFRSKLILNPSFQEQLAEYKAFEKAENEKKLMVQRKQNEETEARNAVKKQSHEERINKRIASIVSSEEKSASEKLKEIEKLLEK